MKSSLPLVVVILAVSAVRGQTHLNYDDGASHRHNGMDDPFVEVSQGTQVDVVDAADIAFLSVFDTSHVEQTGGHVSHIHLYDSSTFVLSGGDFSHLNVLGGSQADLRGGVGTHVRAYDDSVLNVHGGEFEFVTADQPHPESLEDSRSVVNIHGGTIGVAKTFWPGTTNIFSGEVNDINPLSDGAITNVRGGTIGSFTLNDFSVTNVYGTQLELDPDGSVHSIQQFILRGWLEDGSRIDASISLPSRAELNLVIVPEPRMLGGIGLVCLSPWVMRRRSYGIKGKAVV